MNITYNLLPEPQRKSLPETDNLSFGTVRTDHMFVVDYEDGEWHDARIVPYGNFTDMSPGAMCFHYGQALFEGVKAFKHADGEMRVFRFDENAKRLNHSANILEMANIPEELQMEGLMRLLDVDRHWCPSQPQSSIYIRPYLFATQDLLGVKPSKKYRYCIMLSPSGAYYGGGFSHAIRLLISTSFHRAVSGGTGSAKACGNYAASLRPAEFAKKKGADQVLYLDSTNTYIEEVGSMNHYHVLKDGTFIIPTFTETILRSITSLSVLSLADMGYCKARQETIAIKDFLEGIKNGEIVEAGGFGTAAVVSPVGSYLMEDGTIITLGNGGVGKYSNDLYNLYSSIQAGTHEAPTGWLQTVPHY